MKEYKDVFSDKELENIAKEFKRLKDDHYLDHAGSGLYAESQISEIYNELSQNLYSNPHTSKHVGDCIEQIRYRVLKHFNTDSSQYSVVFTSGATAALKLAVECFDFKNKPEINDGLDGTKANTDGLVGTEENNYVDQVKDLKGDVGMFAYLQDCHTSALGLREVAAGVKGAKIKCITRSDFLNKTNSDVFKSSGLNNLFVYPAQCNFSGYKYPLNPSLPTNWYVLLDAASYAANSHLDLQETKPDFVAISFYKIFGYPTGLGALLIRKTSAYLLTDKRYFGGGTVEIALSACRFHKSRQDISERLEDGTVSFLSILSLRHGFDALDRLLGGQSMDRISEHTFGLAQYAYRRLSSLRHSNGSAVVKIYKDTDYESSKEQGGVVNFNLLGPDGKFIGFAEVEHMANLYNIHLRTGCFCNPGACQRHLRLTDEELRKHHLAGHVCGDENDLIDGVPTGSVRISFGYYSTKRNVDALLNMITTCYVDRSNHESVNSVCTDGAQKPSIVESDEQINVNNGLSTRYLYSTSIVNTLVYTLNFIKRSQSIVKDSSMNSINEKSSSIDSNPNINNNYPPPYDIDYYKPSITSQTTPNQYYLKCICVYPVKSCGAFKVDRDSSWPVSSKGLLHDREWMVVSPSGAALTQKQEPALCKIKPFVDLKRGVLVLSYLGLEDLSVPLDVTKSSAFRSAQLCGSTSRVCGDPVTALDCGDQAASWLERALLRPGVRLVKQCDKRSKTNDKQISLVNRAQYLLINSTSVQWLLDRSKSTNIETVDQENDLDNYLDRFRANLIVTAPSPLEENNWKSLQMNGGFELKVDGPCARCQIICIDQKTGQRSPEPLRVISKEFHGKRTFGVYLSAERDVTDGQFGVIRCGPIVTRTEGVD